MKKVVIGLVSVWVLSLSGIQAAPDPRDSIILESKCVAPNLTGTLAFVIKVYITNKDSLTYLTLSLRESTVAGTAYALLNRTGGGTLTFSSVVTPLTGTLRFFSGGNFPQYNDNSPDRFLVAAGFDPGNPDGTIEPPNAARKAVWELKFRHSSDSSGLVELDTIKTTLPTLFTTTEPRDITVNFVKAVIGISSEPSILLLEPSHGASLYDQTPSLTWQMCPLLADSISVSYRVVLADNPPLSPADTSPALSDANFTPSSPLVLGNSYYWKVFALLSTGDTVFASETRRFTIANPHPFFLLSPSNGGKIVRKGILFDWSDPLDLGPSDTITFTLTITSDSSFTSGFSQSGLTGSSFAFSGGELGRGSRYIWRVKTTDTQNNQTTSENIFYFDFLKLGDANTDLKLAPGDIVLLLNNLFLRTPVPLPLVVDMDCSSTWNTADVVIALNVIFMEEPPPCDP